LVVDIAPVGAAFPGRNGPLVCTSTRLGTNQIFSFDPVTGEARQLTGGQGISLEPTPSPDGTRIAFTSTRENADQEIYIMYADGSGVRRLTFSPGEDRPGTFSPDGTRLSFHSGRFPVPPGPGHSALEIFTMAIDGSDVRRMTNNNFQDSFAHWSPQGDRIAFTTNRDADFEIYTLVPVDANADGNADVQTRVTNSPTEDSHAHWSPDGSQLTFHSRRDFAPAPGATQVEIYRANSADGSNAVRLTGPDNIFDIFPVWSPDGQKIAWAREFPGDVWTMNATDGSGKTNLTNLPGVDDTRCDWTRLLPCTVTGAGDIQGTPGDDVICGSPGNDRILALGGNDVIYADAGNDQVIGGPGRDIVFGGHGSDRILGGDDDDTLFGDQGNDFISGEAGNDIASGSEETDQVFGGDGTDECYGEAMVACP
jgi:Tol biopolymer transport system component